MHAAGAEMNLSVVSFFSMVILVAICFPNPVYSEVEYENIPVVLGERQRFIECGSNEFMCNFVDEKPCCISKRWHCDGSRHCWDNSDESFCNIGSDSCPDYQPFFKCHNGKCVPDTWKCDASNDCDDGSDENVSNCDFDKVKDSAQVAQSLSKLEAWLIKSTQTEATTHKWESEDIHRRVVALYYASARNGLLESNELFYKLGSLLLENAPKANLNMGIGNLALYIDALLIFCAYSWNYYAIDLVTQLRKEVNSSPDYGSPFVLLVLCNANITMYDVDVKTLFSEFEKSRRTGWIDMSSLSLMALTCIHEKGHSLEVQKENISELAHQLGEKQSTNGSFGSVPSTALAAQALLASGSKDWSYNKAVAFLLNNQNDDGSFGSLLNTYYVAPVLRQASLLNISHAKCEPFARPDDVIQKVNEDELIRVKYSVCFGNKLNLVHTITLRAPVDSSFYHIMELAADLETKYRFKYVIRNSKPYIYEMNGVQDDPELGKYWFLHSIVEANSTAEVISSSPVDVIVQDKDVYIQWYRSPIKGNSTLLENYF